MAAFCAGTARTQKPVRYLVESCARMAQQSLDDAMVVIQEASAAISQVSSKLNGLESHKQEVVAALKDLSNKVANLESGQSNSKQRARVTNTG